MTHGSLFSGIGGFDLAAEWMGWENVFHCEVEKYKQERLKINFPNSISYGDISTTDFTVHRGIDLLTGGFPCQDASVAKSFGEGQKGLRGERTGLLWQMLRAIKESKTRYIVAENVANFLRVNRGADFRTVLTELARMGYNAEWRVCTASEVGAPHQRKRLYIVGYSNSIRLQKGQTFFSHVREEIKPFIWMPYGTTISISRGGAWNSEPPVLCLDDGVSRKLARQQLHGYGNAVVPQIPFALFKAIKGFDNQTK